MKIIPAIDLKDGKCVRLFKGDANNLTVYNENPLNQAKIFESGGFERVHIIDLDAAINNNKKNLEIIKKIKTDTSLTLQVGGGIRDVQAIKYLIDIGIDNLIVSSMAVEKKDLMLKALKQHPNKIYIGLDVKTGSIMTRGWIKNSNLSLAEVVNIYNLSDIKGFIYTDVFRDGTLMGINLEEIKKLSNLTSKKIVVGGGVKNIQEIKKLKSMGKKNLEGVIVGKAYYSGLINLEDARKFNSNA
ncbi:MAG: Phosphoribosyl isomerase A [Alphaproteobacteria bacterium MarineAlpha5_Bin11]|nr:1-(5-phosphoribosyl)-5-[(5-phosphoribosylamino)methylideneamino]imidazole-4-carboxamide isomerase [Pelagibacteraceae bacterium]PPR44841.1 MAG: Phosphoribosyl isomerase A [Alphaproteobacteria bacterium MarineAlpha5_Bin11]PPR51827.1 MAG: Phosphoribosyl isomerase A [Alphaproteobacteria bacterium MarineAlpha5_Bin10]|tara:strand:+ start:7958 stop:8686 length:729 start_codon:yes stop_codon:yes gene_type:complete